MNTKKKNEENAAQEATLRSEEALINEKGTVPGQQIGLYSKANNKEVRQVVKILNPDKNSLESRG
nr:hypothetical protein [uncultured Bacteroides sp.]